MPAARSSATNTSRKSRTWAAEPPLAFRPGPVLRIPPIHALVEIFMTSRIAIVALAALCAGPAAAAKMHETVLYNFGPDRDSRFPDTDLVADTDGNLYGTTIYGGTFDAGTAFVLKPDGTFKVIWSFDYIDGGNPNGIAIDGNGVLYVTGGQQAAFAAGSIHRGERNGKKWKFKKIHRFCDTVLEEQCPEGGAPGGPLAIAPDGTIYGTTEKGGEFERGTLFKLSNSHGHWRHKVLYSFCALRHCRDGESPDAVRPLLEGNRLYGTTKYTTNQSGTLFSVKTDGTDYRVLHRFDRANGDGGVPGAGVVADAHGVLYGTTLFGGATDEGTVYSYDPATHAYAILHSFRSDAHPKDGFEPLGHLLVREGATGPELIGTAAAGGAHDEGVVFDLSPPDEAGGAWTQSILYSFCRAENCADGRNISSGVTYLNGVLYGAAAFGGAADKGVLYSLTPAK